MSVKTPQRIGTALLHYSDRLEQLLKDPDKLKNKFIVEIINEEIDTAKELASKTVTEDTENHAQNNPDLVSRALEIFVIDMKKEKEKLNERLGIRLPINDLVKEIDAIEKILSVYKKA